MVPTAWERRSNSAGAKARPGASARLIFATKAADTRKSRLEGTRSHGEIGRSGVACDIDVARGIDRYARAAVVLRHFRPGRWSRAKAEPAAFSSLTKASAFADSATAASGLEGARGGGEIQP